jgi:hypothetical protein
LDSLPEDIKELIEAQEPHNPLESDTLCPSGADRCSCSVEARSGSITLRYCDERTRAAHGRALRRGIDRSTNYRIGSDEVVYYD